MRTEQFLRVSRVISIFVQHETIDKNLLLLKQRISSPWVWVCEDKKCLRKNASESVEGTSNSVCKLTCYESAILWPKPTGPTNLSKDLSLFVAKNIKITKLTADSSQVSF